MENNNRPIDYPDKPPRRDRYFNLRLIGTLLLVVGLVFRTMHWPYAMYLLGAGLLIWTIWNILVFVDGRDNKPWDYAYSLGRIALAAALFLQVFLQMGNWSMFTFALAALFFVIGVVLAIRDRSEE